VHGLVWQRQLPVPEGPFILTTSICRGRSHCQVHSPHRRMDPSSRRSVLLGEAGGHPSKYWPRSTCLNLNQRARRGCGDEMFRSVSTAQLGEPIKPNELEIRLPGQSSQMLAQQLPRSVGPTRCSFVHPSVEIELPPFEPIKRRTAWPDLMLVSKHSTYRAGLSPCDPKFIEVGIQSLTFRKI
jgi:hypothetical protein